MKERVSQEEKKVVAPFELDGARFDIAAATLSKNWFPDPLPRSLLQKAIQNGAILLGERVVKAKERVSRGDQITFTTSFFQDIRTQEDRVLPLGEEPSLLAETEHFWVLSKPAGWLTHAVANYQEEATLEDWMQKKGFVPEAAINNGRVHRLDRNTSGLLIYAKNQEAQGFLKKLFQERKVKKTYIALVEGHLEERKGVTAHSIMRKKGSFKRIIASDPSSPSAKPAETAYQVIARSRDYDVILAEPKTGRTHQIRVHLAHLGHPLVGDGLYGAQISALNRQFLHAYRLQFEFQNEHFSFLSPLPKDLKKFLSTLDEEPLVRYDNEALQMIGLKQRRGFFSLFSSKGPISNTD